MAFRRTPGSGRSLAGGRSTGEDLSPRALEAMAHAAYRSRQSPGLAENGGRRPGTDRRECRLRVSVVVTGSAVLVAGVTLAATDASGSGGGPGSSSTLPPVSAPAGGAPNATTAPAHPTGSGTGAGHTTTTRAPTTNARSVTTTPTTVAPAPGGGPAILSLSPAVGGPGTPLTVTGSGFLSADGTIVAEVDGQAAPTSCADQTTCTVTVPSLPGASGSVPVTVTTAAGTSAPASFSYGGGVGAGTSPTPPAAAAPGGGPGGQNQTPPGPGAAPGQRGGSRDLPGKFP